jgi:hypothetical protein
VGFVLGMAFLLAASTLQAGSAASKPASAEPLGILESAFRMGRADRLRELMRSQEKIFLSSPKLALDDGYYSSDQVCLLLQDVFRSHSTVRFNFVTGGDAPRGTQRVVAVSRWTYRRGSSREQTIEIAFTLTRRDGGWSLKEIREVS